MIRSITLSLFIIAFALFISVPKAEAALKPLEGWAWSDTIGWVSFSSENDHDFNQGGTQPSPHTYGVYINDATGEFSGYAWNGILDPSSGTTSGVGWISFNAGETAVCGQAAQLVGVPNPTGEIVGYARVLSGGSGGWTGCLELSGSNHISPEPSGGGGVTFSQTTNTIFGYAWGAIPSTTGNGGNNLGTGCANPPGSDCSGDFQDGIIGWLEFRDVFVDLEFNTTEPNLILQADPYTVYPLGPYPPNTTIFEETTLMWQSNEALTNCMATSSGPTTAGTSEWDGPKPDPSDSQAGVDVPDNPTEYQITCEDSNGNPVASNIVEVFRIVPDMEISFSASEACIPEPGYVDLVWDVQYASHCFRPSDPSNPWELPTVDVTGTESVFVDSTETFYLYCQKTAAPYASWIEGEEVTVEVGGSCAPGDDDDDDDGGGITPRYEEI